VQVAFLHQLIVQAVHQRNHSIGQGTRIGDGAMEGDAGALHLHFRQ